MNIFYSQKYIIMTCYLNTCQQKNLTIFFAYYTYTSHFQIKSRFTGYLFIGGYMNHELLMNVIMYMYIEVSKLLSHFVFKTI